MIDLSTCQENSSELRTKKLSMIQDADDKAVVIVSSDKSETPSQQDTKYEATMRLPGKP